jgi:glycosyltransferase involved in cell wall biosynthesis
LGYIWEYAYSLAAIFFISLIIFLDEGFDIIHAHQPPDAFVFIAAFYKLLGKRYLLDHHDLAPELYNARFRGHGNMIVFRILVWLERFSCYVADHIIATNQSYKQVERQRDHVPDRRITVVRNGPDLKELYITAPDPDLRKMARIVIGYLGVIGTQDGVDYLLRALQHLVYNLGRKDFICVIVGSGDALAGLRSFTRHLGISDVVLFTGWVDQLTDVARYLSSMDICVAPEPSDPYNDRSTAEKVMEYMALGKPIVAFDLPEHRFTAREAAVYAHPNDTLDFARNIVLLMDDPLRRERMGQKGRERIELELGWHCQVIALLESYNKLVLQEKE